MKKQILRFKFALRGIGKTICTENHMRFHIVAAVYVVVFSLFYEFSAVQYAVLAVLLGLVMALEVLNTCIEEVCDLVADRYEPMIRVAKDAAAGAVLITALSAVAVAVLFFWDLDIFSRILAFFAGNIPALCALLVSAVVSVIFVALGPLGIKNRCILRRNKKKNS